MNLDFFLRDIAFYYGTCYTCNAHCGKTINCTEDFDQIVRLVREFRLKEQEFQEF